MPKPLTEKYNRGRNAQTPAMRMARGRPPKKAKDKPTGMKVATVLPDPPEYLEPAARAEWIRLGKYLVAMRRVSELDLQALTIYSTSLTLFGECIRPLLIARSPLWGEVNGRPKPSKLESVAERHALIVLDLCEKFGLTARTRHLDHADRGRPGMPDELHELRGNPAKKKLGRTKTVDRLEWDAADVVPPGWFDRNALDEWYRLINQFETLDVWTPLDVAAISIGCGCYSLLIKCVTQIADEPPTLGIRDAEGHVEHPLSQIYGRHWKICERVWREYGMTPVDRARFAGSVVDPEKPKLSVYGA